MIHLLAQAKIRYKIAFAESELASTDWIVWGYYGKSTEQRTTNCDPVITTTDWGTATTTDNGIDIASGTAVTLGFHVKGTTSVEFFVNRLLVATHTTNLPDDENLAIGAMELSGSATGTKSMAIDYLFTCQTR